MERPKPKNQMDKFMPVRIATEKRTRPTNNEDFSLLVSSSKWLSTYGLKRLKLDFAHILSIIGFRNSDDFINILKKPVSSRYSSGLFKKVAHKNGSYYNIVGSKDTLHKIVIKLENVVDLYKKRLEWLTSSSRRTFGVIEEKRICIIIDIQEKSAENFKAYMQVLVSVIKDQMPYLFKFNLIRTSAEVIKWQPSCTSVTVDSCNDAVSWLLDQPKQTEHSSTSMLESILDASSDKQTEAIYIYTDTSVCYSGTDLLLEKAKDVMKPIHVVCVKGQNYPRVLSLKKLSEASSGRFHVYDILGENKGSASSKNSQGFGVHPDVMKIWEELDEARNTLFDVQSIMSDVEHKNIVKAAVGEDVKEPAITMKPTRSSNELYMSSKQWLKKYGLKKLNLTMFTFLKSSVFNHCDGVLDSKNAHEKKSTLVNARYCSKFAHLTWHDGSIKHVHVTESANHRFNERMLIMLEKYRQRLAWLQKGSRELFGTIIEDRVVILIDTSSSMDSRLKVVKDKLLILFQEQLVNKEKFNVIHFDSIVDSWQDHLVTCTAQNLDSAWQWVKTLSANGSTNTMRALNVAYGMNGVQAIYLLTDGRPDQPPDTVLSHISNSIPIHTISFNCDDAEANQFLYDLSSRTNGRYHFFSEDISADASPRPYESEDLFLLRREIEQGLDDLEGMLKLQRECLQLDKQYKELVQSQNGHIYLQPAGVSRRPRPISAQSYVNNKASLLRMSPNRPQSAIVRSETPSSAAVTAKKKFRKKKKIAGSEIKRWIKKNGITAQKLTILDALAPTIIEQKATYVPALGKEILSKVYGDVLPFVHTSSNKQREFQLVNPQAVDLLWYEDRLKQCLRAIETKLDIYVNANISQDLKDRLGINDDVAVLSYTTHKSDIDADLKEGDLKLIMKDVNLLENELMQGNVFLKQSEDLRDMVDQLQKEAKENKEKKKGIIPEEKPAVKKSFRNDQRSVTGNGRVRYHRVIARSDVDGLYYPAIVNKYVNVRYVSVCFDNGENQLTSVRFVISLGGSTACPSLTVGDYVLVRSAIHKHTDVTETDGCSDCFVPGIVQVTPLRMKSASRCYTVICYNGIKITALRKDMIKITRSRFVFTTRFIQEVNQTEYDRFDGVVKNDHSSRASSRRHSSSSSSSSMQSKRSSQSSINFKKRIPQMEEEEQKPSIPIIVMHSPRSSGAHSSSDESEKVNGSDRDSVHSEEDERNENNNETSLLSNHDEFDGKPEPSNSDQDKFEEWKTLMEEQHEVKMKELEGQKTLLLDLQQRLALNEEKQTQREVLFEKQQQQLQLEQQQFQQKKLEQQNEEQEHLKEKYKDLSEMQLEIFKRQQEQQQQLMQHILEKQEQYHTQQITLQKVIHMIDEETTMEHEQETPHRQSPQREKTPPPLPRLSTPDMLDERIENVTSPDNGYGDEESLSFDPELKVFVDPANEAVLMAQGESGILLSRKPPDVDPVIAVEAVPVMLKMNQEVLARFKDDGWYYRGTLKKVVQDNLFVIQDGVGDMEQVIRDDIITDDDDADNIMQVGDHVIALHPRYHYAYAPGVVHDVEADGALKVQFYDGQVSVIPRAEAYFVSPAKFARDCAYILKCENSLIGQAVVCRDNKTGFYQLAAVRERVAGARNYLVEWSDQQLDIQNYAFIFGAHTKRQNFTKDCHVLGISDLDTFSYLPGVIKDVHNETLDVQFCSSQSVSQIDASQSFWISPDYYTAAVKYWRERNQNTR